MISYEENQKAAMEYFESVISVRKNDLRDPVMGGRNGSRLAGFGNRYSDEDITLLCDDILPDKIWEIIRYDEPVDGDILQVNKKRLYKVLDGLYAETKNKSYPTNFYRTKEEEKLYRTDAPYAVKSDYNECDRLFYTLCHDVLRADILYLSKSHPEFEPDDLYKKIHTIDILDTYYVRAYGNHKFFCSQEQVLCRKYLYTLDHLFAIWWLLENGTRPPLYFPKLREGLPVDSEFGEHIDRCIALNANASSDKASFKVPSDPWLNDRFNELLDSFRGRIYGYDKNETYYDVIQKTPQELRPIITVFDM